METHGPPRQFVGTSRSKSSNDLYVSLLRSIVYQQLAGAAASAIWRRFVALCSNPQEPTPEEVLQLDEKNLRDAGLSARKQSYILSASQYAKDGHLSLDTLSEMQDDDIIEVLTRIKGIGPWSAHMLLIFGLGRMDVLPVGDLGLRKGFSVHFGMQKLASAEEMIERSQHWRPYRSLRCLYMWHIGHLFNKKKTLRPQYW